jgi:dihydrofolate reductase
MVSLIWAMGRNRVIGADNRLPWHLPEDLKYFRRVTQGHPVLMGRKTFDSIGRLLPGRENRIITRQTGFEVPGALVFNSLEDACRGASGELFVIGGSEIYRQALGMADRLYVTLIHQDFEGDAFFPDWDESRFREVSREEHPATAERPYSFSFVVMERVR